jgi:hypothetical protein
MKEIKEVRLHNNNKYIDVDGFFDNNTDSIGINIAEVWFDGVVWIQPQYKNDTKILKAIEQAKQYLSKNVTQKIKD